MQVCVPNTQHSKAKHTKTSEFGGGKGLLQGHARGQVARVPQTPNSSEAFSRTLLKAG